MRFFTTENAEGAEDNRHPTDLCALCVLCVFALKSLCAFAKPDSRPALQRLNVNPHPGSLFQRVGGITASAAACTL